MVEHGRAEQSAKTNQGQMASALIQHKTNNSTHTHQVRSIIIVVAININIIIIVELVIELKEGKGKSGGVRNWCLEKNSVSLHCVLI